ncbi:NAD-dependent epimerase/dehydratase family protein [Agrobacterium tumefaciens]|nr:NAD-dependent epimerase/dehydratase family protein [Agrobacterium tumefaciens]
MKVERRSRFCVLITGAGGFVGNWLRRALLDALPLDALLLSSGRNGEVSGSVGLDPREKWILLDVADEAATAAVIIEWRPEVVIHLAAQSNVQRAAAAPRETFSVNFFGTMNLADAIMKYCPEALLINVGTSEVYGGTAKAIAHPLDEQTLLDPMNAYAVSKASSDLLIGQMSRNGLKSVRFRPFNHTGPFQTDSFVVPAFAAQIARIEKGLQEPTIKVGNLEAQRDFSDVRDIVSAYVKVALSTPPSLEPGMVFNLASGKSRRVGDILESLLAKSNVKIELVEDPSRLRPSDVPKIVGDSSRARQLLNWQPAYDWDETLDGLLDYWREEVRK